MASGEPRGGAPLVKTALHTGLELGLQISLELAPSSTGPKPRNTCKWLGTYGEIIFSCWHLELWRDFRIKANPEVLERDPQWGPGKGIAPHICCRRVLGLPPRHQAMPGPLTRALLHCWAGAKRPALMVTGVCIPHLAQTQRLAPAHVRRQKTHKYHRDTRLEALPWRGQNCTSPLACA